MRTSKRRLRSQPTESLALSRIGRLRGQWSHPPEQLLASTIPTRPMHGRAPGHRSAEFIPLPFRSSNRVRLKLWVYPAKRNKFRAPVPSYPPLQLRHGAPPGKTPPSIRRRVGIRNQALASGVHDEIHFFRWNLPKQIRHRFRDFYDIEVSVAFHQIHAHRFVAVDKGRTRPRGDAPGCLPQVKRFDDTWLEGQSRGARVH